MKPLLRLLVLTGLLHVAAAAQNCHPVVTPWPPEYGGGSFKHAVLGDFLTRPGKSAVILHGTSLYFAMLPGSFSSLSRVCGVSGVTGVAAFSQCGRSAHHIIGPACRDVIFVTRTAAPPTIGVFDGNTRTFVFTDTCFSTPWEGATRITCAQQAGVEVIRIAAQASDGTTVLLAKRLANGTVVEETTIPTNSPIRSLEYVDLDDDNQIELVVSVRAGIAVYELDSTTYTTVLPLYPLDFINAVPVKNLGVNRLGYVTPNFSYPTLKAVFGSPTPSPSLQMTLPENGLIGVGQALNGLAARDIDGDGISELLVARRGWHNVQLLNVATQTEQVLTIVPGVTGTPTLNTAPFHWTDLNEDGIADGLFFWNSPCQMVVKHSLCGPSDTQPPPEHPAAVTAVSPILGGETFGTHIVFEVSKALAGSATHFHITAYHQPNPIDIEAPEPPPLLDGTGAISTTVQIPSEGTTFFVSLPLDPTQTGSKFWPDKDHYYLDVRFYDSFERKVVYSETDGLTMRDEDPHPDGPPLPEVLAHLLTRPLVAGWDSYLIGEIWDGQHPRLPPLDHTPLGGIVYHIEPPPFPTQDSVPD
jgi:hypothetical protein